MKKTRSMLAMLICLVMLVSLLAMSASAVGSASSQVNFTDKAVTAAGSATHTLMGEMGLTVPADSGNWEVVDHFYHLLVPADGFSTCSYVQTLEAPNGEIFAEDVTLDISYGLASKDKNGNPLAQVGALVVYTSADGENWTESWANREGKGRMEDSTAFYINQIVSLENTAGMSKLYVKYELVRYDGYTAGCIGITNLSANTRGANEVVSVIDARNAQGVPGGSALTGDAAKAEIERLGFTIEGEYAWMLNDCYHIFVTPKEGFQQCYLIQTLEAGKGKVFETDVSLTAGYWLSTGGAKNEECTVPEFIVEVSTDGETWTGVYSDNTGHAPEYDLGGFVEGTISLPETAGASKVYVRYSVIRYGGPTAGGLTHSTLVGNVKDAPEGNPKTGDAIAVVLALAFVSAAGAVITTKKFRKEI